MNYPIKTWINPRKVIPAVLFGCAVTAAGGQTNEWSFDLVPYLWLASVDSDVSVPNLPPLTPSGADRFSTSLTGGAMVAAQLRYRSIGLMGDFAWIQTETEGISPGPAFSEIGLKSDLIHATAALTYSLPLHGKFHADVLAGARLWHASEDLEFKAGALPGFNASSDKTWVDPIIGANLSYDLSQRWSLVAKGNVGGFGVSADLAFEAFGGVTYRFTDWCFATMGYRYLHEDYERDQFEFKLDAHGMLLGVGFHF
jgi:opacity protein-like surface antigen